MVAHNAESRGVGVSFVPLAVESLGGWSQEAALQISRISKLVAVSHLFQRLSICGNATMWGSPPSVSLSLDW